MLVVLQCTGKFLILHESMKKRNVNVHCTLYIIFSVKLLQCR